MILLERFFGRRKKFNQEAKILNGRLKKRAAKDVDWIFFERSAWLCNLDQMLNNVKSQFESSFNCFQMPRLANFTENSQKPQQCAVWRLKGDVQLWDFGRFGRQFGCLIWLLIWKKILKRLLTDFNSNFRPTAKFHPLFFGRKLENLWIILDQRPDQ